MQKVGERRLVKMEVAKVQACRPCLYDDVFLGGSRLVHYPRFGEEGRGSTEHRGGGERKEGKRDLGVQWGCGWASAVPRRK
ncbi:hypothetical protein CBR_g37441 [Chara braunii]|uniref:Uncharacterized protein n=1 Tax=Chara braunii TaxID=69332 RepID=A0A388LMU0_CHABU|nr:hypothetical protein CBR_g37441 [Chara braunii]|eukprot:GBG83638.1 hypothetical protein CBR_g37441 [Chara braunii]